MMSEIKTKIMAEKSVDDHTFDESSSALQEIIVESGESDLNEAITKTLKNILELKEGGSESLTHITSVINETYAETTAATVHECLVNAFPDLQAQQSNDQEEIYYLGIKLNSYMTTEERVVEWLKRRFKEDKYGNIAVGTVSDIASKEIGFQRNSLIGTYLRKAFPKVYVRRSDRLRWYCGISLPERVLSDVEKERVAWLDGACAWLRQNMKQTEHGREKCSMVFAALLQYVGKIGVESCLAAVKCVYPTIQRKTFDRTAYYCGIQFADHVDRDDIQVSESKKVKSDSPKVILPITEEEKEIVAWLRSTIKVCERHRERLGDICALLSAKLEENVSEKTCLKYLRKSFPTMVYRKRDGVAFVGGVEIKSQFRPREPWVDKAVEWIKRIIVERDEAYFEKYHPISMLLRKGLQTTNQAKINRVFLLAFPNATIKKSHDGRLVTGVGLAPGYAQIPAPVFSEEDYFGDFTDVDMNDTQMDDDDSQTSFNGTDLNISVGASMLSCRPSLTNSVTPSMSVGDNLRIKQLCTQVDSLNKLVGSMGKEIKGLREELEHSSRQKDSLIVQLQQTLVLLTQQHYQKILKPNAAETSVATSTETEEAELVENDGLL